MPAGTLPRHSRRLNAVRFPVASFCLHQARRPPALGRCAAPELSVVCSLGPTPAVSKAAAASCHADRGCGFPPSPGPVLGVSAPWIPAQGARAPFFARRVAPESADSHRDCGDSMAWHSTLPSPCRILGVASLQKSGPT
jgi:hypothetical protein